MSNGYWPLSFSKDTSSVALSHEQAAESSATEEPPPVTADHTNEHKPNNLSEEMPKKRSVSPKANNFDSIQEASRENSETSSSAGTGADDKQALGIEVHIDREAPVGEQNSDQNNSTNGEQPRRVSSWWFWNDEGPGGPAAQASKGASGSSGLVSTSIFARNGTYGSISNDPNSLGPDTGPQAANDTTDRKPDSADVDGGGVGAANGEAEAWVDWSHHYRRMSSVVSYVYYKGNDGVQGPEPAEEPAAVTESTKAIQKVSENVPNGAQSSWLGWLWGNTGAEDSDDESSVAGGENPENARELYKSAKFAIENSKESSHYAFKGAVGDMEFTGGSPKYQQLELAVSDTITESHPVRYRSKKRPITPNEVQERTLQLQPPATITARPDPASAAKTSSASSIASKSPEEPHDSVVTPNFGENFRTITLQTRLRLLAENILYQHQTSESHLYRKPEHMIVAKKRRRLHKITIVGVHGFLPIKLVRTTIGQSTGNSVQFVAAAAQAVQGWLHDNNPGYNPHDYDIQTIALEGEGKIADRVHKSYRLLENWRPVVEQSDFLFVVAHSQGTPVAIHLLAQVLREMRCPRRVAFLSMAGMTQGPVAGLDSKLVMRAFTAAEREIIGEMFELQKPGSAGSRSLSDAMKVLVHHNVKITFAGAVDDQFVAITSSLANQWHHPNIFRTVYVARDSTTPAFVVTLVRIVATMKNVGAWQDHGLLRDIGDRFVGTVGDGGHCKVPRDQQVYAAALQHGLETTDLTNRAWHPLVVHPTSGAVVAPDGYAQMYMVPWNIRSWIQELVGVRHVGNVRLLRQMVQEYREWKPVNRAWKDVKYCLSALDDLEVDDLIL